MFYVFFLFREPTTIQVFVTASYNWFKIVFFFDIAFQQLISIIRLG